MQTSSLLLVASLGAISVLLMLYAYIFLFDRRFFLVLWFFGWVIIALNYCLDAFYPDFLRQYQWVMFFSLSLYFYANLLISWGTFIFLKKKIGVSRIVGVGILWLILFVIFSKLNFLPVQLIQFTFISVFALSSWVGAAMIGSAKRFGSFILLLGSLNIAWVVNNFIFSYILKMPQMAPYIVSQIILLLNAIGLIQLYFKEQRDAIKKGLDHITYLNYHDELTGLYSKNYFDQRLHELDSTNDCLPISLIIGDMNGLKLVNDVFGHHEGDHWIRRIALIFQKYCRENDIAARWGGDEFAIILPNTDKETALAIRHEIEEACNSLQEMDILLSISLGVATKTNRDVDLHQVLKDAEDMMYEAKLIEGKKARWTVAEALGKQLQIKNYDTKEHIERMESLAKAFGHTLNLSKENLDNLVRAVELHDIGHIGIPKEIVLKKSPLNESEWQMMRRHVEIGYRIAMASGEFAHLADIILSHHELWNGQGYPQGLRGEEIPLMSRIISIMDAYDALTHQQHSEAAKTIDEALHELQLKAGVWFDPALVSLFVGMMNKNRSLLTR